MPRRVLAACLLALPLGVTAQEQYPACRSAIEADVAQRFSQKITRIDWRLVESRGPPDFGQGEAIVSVAECPGYHFYGIVGTTWRCSQPAGTQIVLNYRSSGDGC